MSTQPPKRTLPPRRKRSKLTAKDRERIRAAWIELERVWALLRMIQRIAPSASGLIAVGVIAFATLAQLNEAMDELDDALAAVMVQS